MKTIISLLFILLLAFASFGQRTVSDLKHTHAVALENFLTTNPKYRFLSEILIGEEYMKNVYEWFGDGFQPYYKVGDFNNDKIQDFALILGRRGKRKDNGEGMSKDHRYEYPLAVVIFNGLKSGSFRKAFIEDIESPVVCLLNTNGKKKNELYFGIFESDAGTMIFKPVGKGYIVKYPEAP